MIVRVVVHTGIARVTATTAATAAARARTTATATIAYGAATTDGRPRYLRVYIVYIAFYFFFFSFFLQKLQQISPSRALCVCLFFRDQTINTNGRIRRRRINKTKK